MKILENKLTAAHKNEDFATKVKVEERIGIRNSPVKQLKCLDCSKVFGLPWELHRHISDVHKLDVDRRVVGKPGDYGCLVCGNDHFDRYQLMKHLFCHHSAIDIYAKYQKKIESLASTTHYDRIRNSLFKKIVNDELGEELERILSQDMEF